MPDKQPQYINSIARAVHILELYSKLNVQTLGIAEISKELGIQKTTVFNIVKTLTHLGWMIQDTPNGRYRLGPRILRVSTMVTRSISVEDLILREMHRLRDLYNEDVVLTAMIYNVPFCVEKVQSANMLRIQSKVGRVSSLVRGSTGKTLFAWQTDSFIEATLEQTFPNTPEGDQERARLRQELELIRTQGFCITVSEQDEGVASVSAPIRGSDGIARYSLAVVGAEKRIREKNIDQIRDEVVRTAQQLEREYQLIHMS